MAYEVIYVCNSINNQRIRQGELNILEKHENQLFFEFGSDEMNKKKRFYNDIETLNKDFDALMKLKNGEQTSEQTSEQISEQFEEVADGEFRSVPIFEETKKEIKKETKKPSKEEKKDKYKIIKRKK